jgi:RND family efflux transporter MFP subunit
MKRTSYIILSILVVFGIACCNNNHSGHSHSHDHEDNLQLTAYNQDFELYAKATPFVVGQNSVVLSHFTHLSNFKPLDSAEITLSLIVGSNGIRQTLLTATSKGTYRFNLSPTHAGTGRLVYDIKSGNSTSRIVVDGIEVFADKAAANEHAHNSMISNSNAVTFTKEQSWKVSFATEEVKYEPFGEVIKTTAQILPSQGDERIIVAKSSGVVTFSNAKITEGTAVSAGQELFGIESSNMADNNMTVRYAEASNNYKLAKAEYDRKTSLAKDKIISESELQRSKAEYENAKAVYETIKQNFSKSGQRVSSPISGYVCQLLVSNGEYVEAGHPILSVSQNKKLYIRAELQPRYYSVLNNISTANFRIPKTNTSYRLEDLDGKLVSFGKSAEYGNVLIPVTFEVNNTIGLLSGSFVDLYIKTQSDNPMLTVANGALIEEMGNFFVFVQLTPELFEKREIQKGSTDGYRTAIVSGLQQGERVVAKGAVLVKLAQASGALDPHAGHVH